MTEDEKAAVRAKVKVEHDRLEVAVATMFLGKYCPLIKDECMGPKCSFFMLMGGPNGKIASGACSIPLLASTAGPIADALVQVAQANSIAAPRVIGAPG